MLSYSTLGLPGRPLEELCALLRQHNYEGMEIALTPEQIARCGDEAYWSSVSRAARQSGITITGLHLGNPRLYHDPQCPRLLHPDKAERRKHIELIRAAFEIAGRVGCAFVAAASGAPREDLSHDESWSLLLTTIDEALADQPEDCEFLLEHEPEHFLKTTDQIFALHQRSGGRVYSNLDIGHLEVAGEPIGPSIERLGGVIKNVHLEDIKERMHRHLLPGDGEIDFDEVGDSLRRIRYTGPLTADLYPFVDRYLEALDRAQSAFSKLR